MLEMCYSHTPTFIIEPKLPEAVVASGFLVIGSHSSTPVKKEESGGEYYYL